MAFIVKKNIGGKEYYYLNENKRIGSKVKTKTLAYLGKSRKDAEKKAEEIINKIKNEANAKENKKTEDTEQKEFMKEDNISEYKLEHKKTSIDELANFCKAKGFIFRSSDIYGGFSGFWDFGHLGVELLKNIKDDWWNYFVRRKDNVVGIEASVISHPKTWKASGHLEGFKDIAVVCKKCRKSAKVDANEFGKVKCGNCGGEYEKVGEFNLLFKTNVGALDAEEAYLRGETAQAMFMNFKLINQTSRMQLPFGIAQIGRCFRNEIAPRDFLFRSREFHIAEIEFFISPEETMCSLLTKKHLNLKIKFLDSESQRAEKKGIKETTIGKIIKEKRLGEWHAYWLAEQILWLDSIGLKDLKIREHTKDELSHYSSATFDIDFDYSFGSKEIAGNANRGTYDLTQHQKESGEDMEVFDDKAGKKVLPKVIEPTFGIERVFLALLSRNYHKNPKGETVLTLPPKLSPIKAAVFPIVKGARFEKIAEQIVMNLKQEFNVLYDKSGSIGRRYARNDEIGTPFCITIDGDSLKKEDVTIRDRDTKKQIRVKIPNLKETLKKLIEAEISFDEAGKPFNF